jgi:hypothetical protein
MNRFWIILLVLVVIEWFSGCSNTRYITDQKSVELQHQMHKHRSGVKAGDILLSTASFIMSLTLGSEFEVSASERHSNISPSKTNLTTP